MVMRFVWVSVTLLVSFCAIINFIFLIRVVKNIVCTYVHTIRLLQYFQKLFQTFLRRYRSGKYSQLLSRQCTLASNGTVMYGTNVIQKQFQTLYNVPYRYRTIELDNSNEKRSAYYSFKKKIMYRYCTVRYRTIPLYRSVSLFGKSSSF